MKVLPADGVKVYVIGQFGSVVVNLGMEAKGTYPGEMAEVNVVGPE